MKTWVESPPKVPAGYRDLVGVGRVDEVHALIVRTRAYADKLGANSPVRVVEQVPHGQHAWRVRIRRRVNPPRQQQRPRQEPPRHTRPHTVARRRVEPIAPRHEIAGVAVVVCAATVGIGAVLWLLAWGAVTAAASLPGGTATAWLSVLAFAGVGGVATRRRVRTPRIERSPAVAGTKKRGFKTPAIVIVLFLAMFAAFTWAGQPVDGHMALGMAAVALWFGVALS